MKKVNITISQDSVSPIDNILCTVPFLISHTCWFIKILVVAFSFHSFRSCYGIAFSNFVSYSTIFYFLSLNQINQVISRVHELQSFFDIEGLFLTSITAFFTFLYPGLLRFSLLFQLLLESLERRYWVFRFTLFFRLRKSHMVDQIRFLQRKVDIILFFFRFFIMRVIVLYWFPW